MVSINVLLKRLCLQNGDVNFRLRLRFHRSKILAPAPAIQYCLCSGFLLHRPVCNYLGQFAQKSHFLQNIKKWTPGRWRQTCTLRECLSNTEALSFRISLILLWLLILILQPLQTFVELAGFERVTTTPTEFHIAWFILSLQRPDLCGSEHLFHREKLAVTQHSLRNCVDHLGVLSHIGYVIRCKLSCYTPLPTSQGATPG